VEDYVVRLFGYGLSLSRDREVALELVQDCAVKALAASEVPDCEPAYRAWLFRILRNTFIDRVRRNGEAHVVLDHDNEISLDETWNCEESLVNRVTVRMGLDKLTPAHREIIALIDIAGFSYEEAADMLQVPAGTVMSRLSRARQGLLAIISDENIHSLPARRKRNAQ
jgi:RNA polymerase sigma-70 factor (ECF subfamily)